MVKYLKINTKILKIHFYKIEGCKTFPSIDLFFFFCGNIWMALELFNGFLINYFK